MAKPAAPKKKPAKRAKASGTGAVTLTEAVRDLKSYAYRELLAAATPKEIDELLAGVAWVPGKHATVPGELRGNALFTGRGTTARPMMARLLAFLAVVKGAAAAGIRSEVESLGIDAKAGASIDVAALASMPALAWVQLRDAASLTGTEGFHKIPNVTLWRIEEIDLAALPGPPESRLVSFDARRVRGVESPGRAHLSLLPAPPGTDLTHVGATSLSVTSVMGETTIGPIGGPMVTLSVTGPYQGSALERVELGALPHLTALDVSAHATLREVIGLERVGGLRELTLGGMFTSIPPLCASLRRLNMSAPLTDARALASASSLTSLELRVATPVRELPGLEAIGAMSELESLRLSAHTPLAVLDTLPVLPRLRSISLDQQELERVPDLARFGPEIETVSLLNARGFLEHDTLRRLPKLKRLFIARSTPDSRGRRQTKTGHSPTV